MRCKRFVWKLSLSISAAVLQPSRLNTENIKYEMINDVLLWDDNDIDTIIMLTYIPKVKTCGTYSNDPWWKVVFKQLFYQKVALKQLFQNG